MILTLAIIFTLAGLGVMGSSAYQYIVIAKYAQDQALPAAMMAVGSPLLAAGGIMFCIWLAVRSLAKLSARPAGPDPAMAAIAEAFGVLHKSTTHTNELLEKILARTGAAKAAAPPGPLTLYYFADAQMKPQGPFTSATLKEMLSNGTITKETQVVMSGSDKWAAASTYPDLG